MKEPDFIAKEKRDWYVKETLNECFDPFDINTEKMTLKKIKKLNLKRRKPCDCRLAGWLLCEENYYYCATQSFDNNVYAAIYAGKDETTNHDDKPEISIIENPYLIYALGCDDVSYSARFKTKEEMMNCLKSLKTFNDLKTHPNVLWNN